MLKENERAPHIRKLALSPPTKGAKCLCVFFVSLLVKAVKIRSTITIVTMLLMPNTGHSETCQDAADAFLPGGDWGMVRKQGFVEAYCDIPRVAEEERRTREAQLRFEERYGNYEQSVELLAEVENAIVYLMHDYATYSRNLEVCRIDESGSTASITVGECDASLRNFLFSLSVHRDSLERLLDKVRSSQLADETKADLWYEIVEIIELLERI
ncbi:hypothetical protein [Roseobacter weihaiensis]|uniref:hypothetical protein n=1 Tax=Roseobacter weihaiensis TaxID=2763262 RepID=UPI001D0BE32A|nr:hypothetical protein [Roseobacter sp. H9]